MLIREEKVHPEFVLYKALKKAASLKMLLT
jgi:hypothetical protein